MELTPDNIKTISQYADRLEKWSENLSYSVCPPGNLWMQLTLSLHPLNVEGFASWLTNIPDTGQKAGRELAKLSKLVQEVDAWRNHGVYAEDLGDFCARINRLMKVTRNIISLLRNMSGSSEPEPPGTKAVAAEESNAPEKPQRVSNNPISEEALMAYKFHHEMGLTLQQVAKRMTSELKLDTTPRPWQISRWIKQAENRKKTSQIPIRSINPQSSNTIVRSTKTDSTKT